MQILRGQYLDNKQKIGHQILPTNASGFFGGENVIFAKMSYNVFCLITADFMAVVTAVFSYKLR